MRHGILNIKGVAILKKEAQKSIHGGSYGCDVARKCFDDSECCSGVCGVERIIFGRPVIISVCAF